MKRRTRLGSSPVKVFGSHVYQPDGTRSKVHLGSFASVAEAREFAVFTMTAIQLHPNLRDFESVCVVRGNGEVASTFLVDEESQDALPVGGSREASMHPQGASLERASAADIDRSESCTVFDPPSRLRVSEGFAAITATLTDSSSLSSCDGLPGESVGLLAPRLGRGGGA